MRRIHALSSILITCAILAGLATDAALADDDRVPVGVIGLDTSHAPAFAQLLNDENPSDDLAGFRVVAAYPHGSADIESSVSRIPQYTESFEEMGITITESIDELLDQVEVVILTTNDGRPRLEQALQVIRAGKPMFMDKPASASLAELIAMYDAAEAHGVPIFTSSSLRYIENAAPLAAGEHGDVRALDTWGPASLEPNHPDLYWYMVHAVEPLVTVLGPEIESVTRTHTEGQDAVVGVWSGGRIGTMRGMRDMSPGFGGTAFTSEGVSDLGDYPGYRPLVADIVEMFRSGESPVPAEQCIAVYAFMDAAEESQARGGEPVSVPDVIAAAREEARELLE